MRAALDYEFLMQISADLNDPRILSGVPSGTRRILHCERGSFRGPGLRDIDVSLGKSFPITEHQSFEFRAEAINFTNTPIFARPTDFVSSADPNFNTFGLVTTSQGARNIQFGLKYKF